MISVSFLLTFDDSGQLREVKENWEQLLAEKEYLQGRMQKLSFDMEEIKALQILNCQRSFYAECPCSTSLVFAAKASSACVPA